MMRWVGRVWEFIYRSGASDGHLSMGIHRRSAMQRRGPYTDDLVLVLARRSVAGAGSGVVAGRRPGRVIRGWWRWRWPCCRWGSGRDTARSSVVRWRSCRVGPGGDMH